MCRLTGTGAAQDYDIHRKLHREHAMALRHTNRPCVSWQAIAVGQPIRCQPRKGGGLIELCLHVCKRDASVSVCWPQVWRVPKLLFCSTVAEGQSQEKTLTASLFQR